MAARKKNYWLVKSEPFKYSWDEFVKDGWTYWDGVRNYQARNRLHVQGHGAGCWARGRLSRLTKTLELAIL